LYPAYWFSIISAVVIGLGVGVNIISVDQVLLNFTMVQKYLGVESVIGAYWTLHLELVFYVLCAFLFAFGVLQKNNYLILLMIFFCLSAVCVAVVRYYYNVKIPTIMPFGLAVMFYGALLRNYFIAKQTELRIPLIMLTVFYFICLFVASNFYYQEGWLKWFTSHLAAFAVFYILITKVKLHNALAVYLGRISYSLYLLHSMVIGVVFNIFGDFAYTEYGFYLVIISVLVCSVLFAEFSYRFIEKPGVRLAGRYTRLFNKRDVRSA